MKQKLNITGMTCSACQLHVEKSVQALKGIHSVNVNLLLNNMVVDYDENIVSEKQIIDAVESGGYGACPIENGKQQNNKAMTTITDENEQLKKKLWISSLLLLVLMYVSMGHMIGLPLPGFLHGIENTLSFAFTQFLLATVILLIQKHYFINGFKALINKAANMDSLIAIGAGASYVYGIFAIYMIGYGLGHYDLELVARYGHDLYFESAAMIVTLISIGKYLESRSKGKTSDAIARLMDLAPKKVTVIRNNQEVLVDLENVQVKDRVVVKNGQRIPVDGVVIEGSGYVDQAALTGESIPVKKEVKDTLMSASLVQSGHFIYEATHVGQDTTLAKIITLVEEASSSKAPISRMADKVSSIFVPAVLAISLVTFIVWLMLGYDFTFALSMGISVLVISCPCALGLATPTAIMVGTGKGAENGILIKSAESLEITHEIDTIVFDKTGTLTYGHPVVSKIITNENKDEMLRLAASLEIKSEHPLGKAIVNYAKDLKLSHCTDLEIIVGQGIKGVVDGYEIALGNKKMMESLNAWQGDYQITLDDLGNQAMTPLMMSKDGQVVCFYGIKDEVKPLSIEAIERLKEMNINLMMLTGDQQKNAHALQKQLGLNDVMAEVLPQDKEAIVSKLIQEGHKVMMVGDGINDAPALSRANVGVAIGAGSDIAIDSADIILIRNDLRDVVSSIELSKKVILNIKENLFWAFIYNMIGIPLAAGVFYPLYGWRLFPMFGAACMSLSSFCVVSNALRLRFFKPSFKNEIKEKKNMTKTIKIEGMMCPHCVAHVKKALESIEGVQAEVNLENKQAVVTMQNEIARDVLEKTVVEAGYEVKGIE